MALQSLLTVKHHHVDHQTLLRQVVNQCVIKEHNRCDRCQVINIWVNIKESVTCWTCFPWLWSVIRQTSSTESIQHSRGARAELRRHGNQKLQTQGQQKTQQQVHSAGQGLIMGCYLYLSLSSGINHEYRWRLWLARSVLMKTSQDSHQQLVSLMSEIQWCVFVSLVTHGIDPTDWAFTCGDERCHGAGADSQSPPMAFCYCGNEPRWFEGWWAPTFRMEREFWGKGDGSRRRGKVERVIGQQMMRGRLRDRRIRWRLLDRWVRVVVRKWRVEVRWIDLMEERRSRFLKWVEGTRSGGGEEETEWVTCCFIQTHNIKSY